MFDWVLNITDEDIEKALECCIHKKCNECKYNKWQGDKCISYLQCDACSLIKRQNEEIEYLKGRN